MTNGLPDEALELIHIHTATEETRPSINAVIYTTVLKRIVMARQFAFELVITTFSTLVKRYCSAGHVYNALPVMDEIKSLESFAPDEIMYDCPEKQNVDEGLRLFNEMRAARIAPSNYTLNMMVKPALVPGLSVGPERFSSQCPGEHVLYPGAEVLLLYFALKSYLPAPEEPHR